MIYTFIWIAALLQLGPYLQIIPSCTAYGSGDVIFITIETTI